MTEEIIRLIIMLLAMTLGSAGAVMVFGIEKRAFWWAVLCVLLAAIGFEVPRFFGVGFSSPPSSRRRSRRRIRT